jgi:dihydrodipicolinate synthase/N-acetylneuraminate lyase
MRMRVTTEDITGIVGIIPSPATPDAADFRAQNTVNLEQTAKLVRILVETGIDVIMTTGTFGECATLTWDELRDLVDCVVQTAQRRRPIFAGVTTLNTRDTISRARALIDLGVDGLFVGRPMWLALDDKLIVRFYRDMAQALPGVPLVVYDNPLAFKGKISTEVYRELTKIPEIVASKHVGGPTLEQDLLAVGDKIRLLPLEVDWYGLAQKYPDASACWSGGVACAPAPLACLAIAIRQHDWEQARKITERLVWAISPMFPEGSLAKFMDYSIQLGHARFQAAGLIDPGPARPPYVEAPDAYVDGALECGRRWAVLQAEFQPMIKPQPQPQERMTP